MLKMLISYYGNTSSHNAKFLYLLLTYRSMLLSSDKKMSICINNGQSYFQPFLSYLHVVKKKKPLILIVKFSDFNKYMDLHNSHQI